VILEVCIDSVESAIAAQKGGAQRVELCADLAHGGTTPSAGMIRVVREGISIALHSMIRPRPGDFCYSAHEYDVMVRDVEIAKRMGADGVVIGILTSEGAVDSDRVGRLVELARPLSVTFHRAIDECRDLLKALNDLKKIGVNRILTSGGKANVADGVETLKMLVEDSGPSLRIIAGGGITMENVRGVVSQSGVKEVHALSAVSSLIQEPGSPASQGSARHLVDPEKVRLLLHLLQFSSILSQE
jgi:copper homeostasis protein